MKKIALAVLGMSLVAGASMRSIAAEPSADMPRAQEVPIEVVQNPKIVHWATRNLYPDDEIRDGREGWVVVSLMIDPAGKPYDAMVSDSSGNPAFERAALKGLDKMTFEPAQLNGKPVDGSFTFKMIFTVGRPAERASWEFVAIYKQFMKAIDARDKAGAEGQLALLKPMNLYEDAFANLGKYNYHAAWGTLVEQREDLSAAIANERKPTYLPKDLFVTALYLKFKLEATASEYGAALRTWEVLEPLADSGMRQNVQKVVDEIHALQASNRPTRARGVLNERGRWSTTLLRNRFNVDPEGGSISDVKLSCERKNLSFKFQPDMQYSIGSSQERCDVTLIGQPGTSFEFNQ